MSSNSMRMNQESSNFNYISNVSNYPLRRPTDPRIYRSFVFSESNKPEPYHRVLMSTEYKKYDNTSQITNLPGAVKRVDSEINDNYKPNIIPDKSESHLRRITRDYNSNIACLPGSKINEEKQRNYYVCPMKIKYECNNIFGKTEKDIKNNNENTKNTNYIFHKKQSFKSNAFADSKSHFDYNAPTTGVRRSGIKNFSQIQLI